MIRHKPFSMKGSLDQDRKLLEDLTRLLDKVKEIHPFSFQTISLLTKDTRLMTST